MVVVAHTVVAGVYWGYLHVLLLTQSSRLWIIYEPRCEKTNALVSDQVPHKPGCTATEDGQRLEILDLESRGIVLSR